MLLYLIQEILPWKVIGTLSGHGSHVVKVLDRGWPCHEFEPSTAKEPPCRGTMYVKSVESSNASSRGAVWYLGEEEASSGVAHVT
ncbi:hypothetical protein TNCV_5083241 [Trichonephila clavipes]|nr:hypothetical protein TNCV_5083241 [Trichonephila clavipes]